MMRRREVLTGGLAAGGATLLGAALPRPALAQGERARTLIFVPQANLTSLDPVWTTATVTRNFGFLVYDTLYGLDASLQAQPQMAAGHTIDADGKRWTVKLRDGLTFHDGTPVLARDCTASLARWMKRDTLGQTLADRLDAMETPDDKTIVFRLKRPFPPLAYALARTQPSPPIIMPERLAKTDPFKAVNEVMGSGPFRWVADEYNSGSQAVFARFEGNKPRDEAPSFTAGGKRALVDRVLWKIIPEAATAGNALKAGEVDWVESPIPDLLPLLRADKNVVVAHLDPYGVYPVLRFNTLQGPTASLAVRQAILAAIDPVEVMQAVMGDEKDAYHAPIGCFLPDSPMANDAAMSRLGGQMPVAQIQAMLKEGGYKGERVLLMHPTDQPFYDAMAQVCAARCKAAGINVDDSAMDWGTVVQRRTSKEPLDKGGWSMFPTGFPAVDYFDPLTAPALRGNGAAAYYGWPTDAKIESLRDEWIDNADPDTRKRLARSIQEEALTQAFYVPLGQYLPPAAWRSNITGQLKGPVPLFWNVSKA